MPDHDDVKKRIKGLDENFIKNNAEDIKKFAQSDQGKLLIEQLQKSMGGNSPGGSGLNALDEILKNPGALIDTIQKTELPESIKKLLRG